MANKQERSTVPLVARFVSQAKDFFFDGMEEALINANEGRTKRLENLKTEKSNSAHIALKQKKRG